MWIRNYLFHKALLKNLNILLHFNKNEGIGSRKDKMTRNPTVTGSDQIRIRQDLDPQYDYTV